MTKTYSCDEIAVRYGVKVITVRDWIRKKKLLAIKVGKSYRVSDEHIQRFEDERKTI